MNDNLLKLMIFSISSSIGCINEPKIYGPLRLLEVTEKLIELYNINSNERNDQIIKILDMIKKDKLLCMTDEEKFKELLNKVLIDIIKVYENKEEAINEKQ
jgi:hypothetical protein